MGKTTNILDLNNRLTKVEKENVAQNSYTSLKNKPKINNVILTGNKTNSDLGLAAAGDITDINTAIGNMSDLGTTATDLVGAINEVNEKFVIDTVSSGDVSDNVAAGGYKLYSLNADKSGYIPIGIMGIYKQGTNQSNCTIAYFRLRVDNGTYYSDCMLQNNASGDSTITKIEFTVLYKAI